MTRSSAAAGSGARPRFVWTITPVAFSTRRSCGPPGCAELVAQPFRQVARLRAGADLLARAIEHAPRRVDREWVVDRPRELVHRGKVSKLHCRKDRALPVRRLLLLAVLALRRSSLPPPLHRRRCSSRTGPLPAHGIKLSARAAILVDADTGKVLWGRYIHRRLHIASTTKILTALVAMDRLGPRSIVTVDRAVRRVPPIVEGLRPGERVQAWKLFYGLLLYSGNDDALALAVAAGGTRARFVALMNEKARSLGMHESHFRSPSGLLDRDNYSTAWDMAAL